jgi:hypothetical protein
MYFSYFCQIELQEMSIEILGHFIKTQFFLNPKVIVETFGVIQAVFIIDDVKKC